jgi:hypothetical protein
MLIFAPVAQWIEQQPSKLLVVGSNPAGGVCYDYDYVFQKTLEAAKLLNKFIM